MGFILRNRLVSEPLGLDCDAEYVLAGAPHVTARIIAVYDFFGVEHVHFERTTRSASTDHVMIKTLTREGFVKGFVPVR